MRGTQQGTPVSGRERVIRCKANLHPAREAKKVLECRCSRAAWKLLAGVAKAPCPVPSCPQGGVGVGWGEAEDCRFPSVETETAPPSDSQGPTLFKWEPSIISGFPKARLFGLRVMTCPPRQILRVGAASVTRKGVSGWRNGVRSEDPVLCLLVRGRRRRLVPEPAGHPEPTGRCQGALGVQPVTTQPPMAPCIAPPSSIAPLPQAQGPDLPLLLYLLPTALCSLSSHQSSWAPLNSDSSSPYNLVNDGERGRRVGRCRR